ncbi:beta-propeller fold lactonase family protein [bacterium]|nr:beta-propeller fold lactonase family protein [bacterium]MBU1598905.1 beta-propeller fold lactonase family protein [bacterium]
MKRLIFLFSILCVSAYPFTHTSHPAGAYTLSCALDDENNRLYLSGTSMKNIVIYNLDEDGLPVGQFISCEIPTNCISLALFSNKLYIGNSQDGYLYIYQLGKDGLLTGTPTLAAIATEGQGAYSLAIDPGKRKLYVGNMAGANNICVYSLDSSGLPTGAPSFFTTSGYTTSLALNPIQGKLYIGSYSGDNPFVCWLAADGSLTGRGWKYNSGNLTYSMALDIEKRRLYLANNNASDNLSVVKLDEEGLPSTYTTYSDGGASISLALNKRSRKLYVGKNYAGSNLYVYDLDHKGDLQGKPTILSLGGPTFSLAIGKRLYLANYQSDNNLWTLEIPDARPQVLAPATTTTQKVTLRVSSANPHWIKIQGDISQPLGWKASDGGAMEIPVYLTKGEGDKKIDLLFLESAGFGNYSAVLRKESVSINLQKDGTKK